MFSSANFVLAICITIGDVDSSLAAIGAVRQCIQNLSSYKRGLVIVQETVKGLIL
jgi:hypothetical protein